MTFAGMNDEETMIARSRKHSLRRLNRPPKKRNVVAQHLPKPTLFHEVPLEINHDQGGGQRIKLKLIRPRFDNRHALSFQQSSC
jgi:hypothetical protein